MDSSAIFASPFLSLVFKGFEFLEPSDLMSPWQTVRKSTARSLQSSASQSCLRAILIPHWSYSIGLPTYLTYSFLVLPSPSPHSFSWHPPPSFKWKSDSLLLKISSRAIALQGDITKANGLHLHDASILSLCQPLHTSTYYTFLWLLKWAELFQFHALQLFVDSTWNTFPLNLCMACFSPKHSRSQHQESPRGPSLHPNQTGHPTPTAISACLFITPFIPTSGTVQLAIHYS